MLVIPVNKEGNIYSIGFGIKDRKKIGKDVYDENLLESDIVVNSERFSESSYHDSALENAPTDFIRSRSIYYQRKVKVSTKSRSNSRNYDVYEVAPPPRKVNDDLDCLYGKAITDLRKEIPDSIIKGRFVSLEQFGFKEIFSEEKIDKMQRIIEEENDSSRWPELFEKEGIGDLQEVISFLDIFEFKMLPNKPLPEASLQETIDSFGVIHNKHSRSLNNYKKMAQENMDLLVKISNVKKSLYDTPLTLVASEKPKVLIKTKENEEHRQAA